MILHDPVADRQAKPGSVGPGREKRIEDLLDIISGNAAAIIGNFDLDSFSRPVDGTSDRDPTVFCDRLQCIEQQVDKYLFDLGFIQHRFGHVLGQLFIEMHMPQVKLIAYDAEGVFHNIVDVGQDLLRLSMAREFE
jgi:hypothetical protein